MGTNLGQINPDLARTEEPMPHDFIWMAGFFEGDGHPSYARTTEQATLTQKDRWVLDKAQRLFGGKIGGPFSDRAYYWRVSGARARGFLMSIYELMSPRRQAQIRRVLNHGKASL